VGIVVGFIGGNYWGEKLGTGDLKPIMVMEI
jgi:hypothetical protein